MPREYNRRSVDQREEAWKVEFEKLEARKKTYQMVINKYSMRIGRIADQQQLILNKIRPANQPMDGV